MGSAVGFEAGFIKGVGDVVGSVNVGLGVVGWSVVGGGVGSFEGGVVGSGEGAVEGSGVGGSVNVGFCEGDRVGDIDTVGFVVVGECVGNFVGLGVGALDTNIVGFGVGNGFIAHPQHSSPPSQK